ncbi:hypothetical protein [Streptomyces sp. CRN 30]|uniref:hypothetical protein n=1 Tax=Streptomyces sp. CRN 30 TaxID=3075613 RepID=UPI002A810BB0|nr:hypothetical protein [Streptomyces sp. CRN 30]
MSNLPTPRDERNLPALSPQPLIRLDAYVAEDGSTVVNGHLLEMAGTQPSNELILDAVAMFARTLRAPVAATVIDRAAQQVARLRVYPDGSSRTIGEEEDLPPGPERTAAEEASFPPLARVERIIRHAEREELHAAFVLASALREHLTLRRGPLDDLSLEARAIEAYLAFRRGDYTLATVLSLAVARIRCRVDLPRAAPDVARATAAWQRLTDETQIATRGQELLHMWDRLAAEGLVRDPAHHAVAQSVRTRLERGNRAATAALPAGAGTAAPAAGAGAEDSAGTPGIPGRRPAEIASETRDGTEDEPLKPTRRGLRRFTRWPGRTASS